MVLSILLILAEEVSGWDGSVKISSIWGLVIILGMAVGALAFLYAITRKEVRLVNKEVAEGNAGLAKTRGEERDTEQKKRQEIEAKLTKAEDELEDVTAELRTVLGIKLEELRIYWAEYNDSQAEKIKMKAEIKILKKAAGIDSPRQGEE